MHIIKYISRIKKGNKAVSEMLGTVLLLGIVVSVFTILYLSIMSSPAPNPPPIVEISGKFFENQIILTHHGGEPLDISSEVHLTIGGKTEKKVIGDYLDDESKENGFWDFSEEFVYPVSYDFDYSEYPNVDVDVLDLNTNSLVFLGGGIGVNPVGDLDIVLIVDYQFPKKGDTIIFNVTACNNGNVNASGVMVNFVLPEELIHISNTSTHGNYDNHTGIWQIGTIPAEECAHLEINALVADTGSSKLTQLAMLLDGSGSISPGHWMLTVMGLADAIENPDIFPHDEIVELSIVQFGYFFSPRAELEIGPIIVNQSNAVTIANNIRNLSQMENYTPTACAILLGADTMYDSLNNPGNGGIYDRQVTILVTDGDPTRCCYDDGDYISSSWGEIFGGARSSSEDARDYLINKLSLTTDDDDQFNVIAVGESLNHAPWLKEEIVWPEPGYFAPPFIIDNPYYGWVRNVTTYGQFANTIDELFGIIFNKIPLSGEISSDYLTDPRDFNNIANIIIVPHDE